MKPKTTAEKLLGRVFPAPGKGIVAGNTVFQFRKGPQQIPLGVAEELHIGTGLTAADHRA